MFWNGILLIIFTTFHLIIINHAIVFRQCLVSFINNLFCYGILAIQYQFLFHFICYWERHMISILDYFVINKFLSNTLHLIILIYSFKLKLIAIFLSYFHIFYLLFLVRYKINFYLSFFKVN